jgi:hypothetical protein
MKRHGVLELACLAFALQGTLALGQAPAQQNSQTAVFATQAPLVVVPALVRTKGGDVIFTLTANDFDLPMMAFHKSSHLKREPAASRLHLW